jgi:hypothetical protein
MVVKLPFVLSVGRHSLKLGVRLFTPQLSNFEKATLFRLKAGDRLQLDL